MTFVDYSNDNNMKCIGKYSANAACDYNVRRILPPIFTNLGKEAD